MIFAYRAQSFSCYIYVYKLFEIVCYVKCNKQKYVLYFKNMIIKDQPNYIA